MSNTKKVIEKYGGSTGSIPSPEEREARTHPINYWNIWVRAIKLKLGAGDFKWVSNKPKKTNTVGNTTTIEYHFKYKKKKKGARWKKAAAVVTIDITGESDTDGVKVGVEVRHGR